MIYIIKHKKPIHFIQSARQTIYRAHQAKIVGPVTAIRTQVALATAYSIHFTFQVDN